MAPQVIRVLLIDASAAGRTAVKRVLAAESRFELAAAVGNCESAKRTLHASAVDLVLVAERLPEGDGVAFIEEIRQDFRQTACVLLAGPDANLARLQTRAISAGAVSAISGLVGQDERPQLDALSAAQFLDSLKFLFAPGNPRVVRARTPPEPAPVTPRASGVEPTVKRLAKASIPRESTAPSARTSRVARGHVPMRIDVILIGCSTGGPHALHRVLGSLPHDLPIPIVITQHVPAGFSVLLADQLSHSSGLPVREATAGSLLRPGDVWIAPHDRHLGFDVRSDGVVLRLRCAPPVHSCRPAVDPMILEANDVWGPRMLVAILTGMGYDGRDGCIRTAENGGYVIAQDEATSVVWGMPGGVAQAGAANQVLPLDEIGPAIVRQLSFGRNYSPNWKQTG